MTALYKRLAAAIDPARSVTFEDERLFAVTGHRAAAVLIAITDRPEPGVILTLRPEFLRSHAGQVAFPGGKIDDSDHNEVAAALREAEEELAIPAEFVNVVGVTDVYFSGSGYRITPVVAVIPPDLRLVANPNEVEDWFEVPLHFLTDPANTVKKSANWNGHAREYYDMNWQGRRIWGVTAGIIANFVRRLREDEVIG